MWIMASGKCINQDFGFRNFPYSGDVRNELKEVPFQFAEYP